MCASIQKIVSGGQTGVDRAALDVAIFLEIDHGGWCPAGRRAEDGEIPDTYQLRETEESGYSIRTERNVVESDGTLILYCDEMTGGTRLTKKFASKHKRNLCCVDLECCGKTNSESDCRFAEVKEWISEHGINVLNIAGPRETSCPGIGKLAEQFLVKVLS